jgi:SAM-dependent methyltransferase
MECVVQDEAAGRHLSRLVDYGCGNMPYRGLFESHVAEYLGADFDGNELADIVLDGGGRLPLDAGSADIVLSTQVLEHVAEPDAYLSEAHRVLRPIGRLILSTHGLWRYHADPCDYWRWTCDGLRRQIERAGFEVLRLKGVMAPEATALQLYQDAVLKRVPRRLRPLFIRYMQWRIRRADQRCPDAIRNTDACVYVVVANKHDQPVKARPA